MLQPWALFVLCCHVLPHLLHSQACCHNLCSTWSRHTNSLHAHIGILHAQAPMHQQLSLLSLYLLMLVACGYHGNTHAYACHSMTRILCLALSHSSLYFSLCRALLAKPIESLQKSCVELKVTAGLCAAATPDPKV